MTSFPPPCPTQRALVFLLLALAVLALAPRLAAKVRVVPLAAAPGIAGTVGGPMLGATLGSPLQPWDWVPPE